MVTCHRDLTAYWFEFALNPGEADREAGSLEGALDPIRRLARGVGVTAESPAVALDLIRGRFAGEGELPEVAAMVEGVDPAELPAEVLTSMGPGAVRGIWFPV